QRYGSSHIGATAKDISNVVTDAASGVVDIFHGIDKAVAETWDNFWKDGKADGIGSNLSRKEPSGLTPSQLYVFMPPNLGGFFMVRSYYPSECHADYFDFERIEALKPAIEACGISTLSQSPMLGFHKQMDNRIKLLKRFCLFVCRALSSIMVICMLTAIRLLLTFVMSLYLLLRSYWMNWHNATMCSPNLILITL